ncbi:MAG TPA: ATP-binding protein [Caulobacteraceae bacterium]
MRRTLSVRLVFQATFGVVAAILLAVCATYAAYTYQRWGAAERVQATVGVSRDLFIAMQDIRHERGLIAAALESGAPLSNHDRIHLPGVQARAALMISSALARLDRLDTQASRSAAARLRDERRLFQAAEAVTDHELATGSRQGARDAQAWIAANDRFVETMVAMSSDLSDVVHRKDGFLGRMVSVSRMAWAARSAAGDTWLTLHRALVHSRPMTLDETRSLWSLMGRVDGAWAMIADLSRLSDSPPEVNQAIGHANRLYFDLTRSRMTALEADLDAGRPSAASGAAWLAAGEPGLASLTEVGIVAFDQASSSAGRDSVAAERRFFLALGVMLLVVGCGWAASVLMVRRYARPMSEVTDAMRALAAGDLESEIPCLERGDEIGSLAQALGVFRENARAKARIEGELRRTEVAREAAEAASQVKSQFLANMSHEIRTPLNGVLGMVQAMERQDASPSQRERLRIIRESGETLLQILNDVLDFSKIEAGKLELHPQPFDLGELAWRTCAMFADTAAGKGLQLTCEVGPEVEGLWEGDPPRLRQMLMNLVSNAVKFTEKGQVIVAVTASSKGVRVTVRDTGAGIDPEALPRLFHKFSQADESVTRRFGGTGLGLAICRELATLMGGDVAVRSVVAKGSEFALRLPLKRLEAAPAARTDAPAAAPAPEAAVREASLRVLAAEDNRINQKVLAAFLELLDVDLTLVSSGREAIEAWKTGRWDVILMDIQMPDMSGVEATSFIRAAEIAEGRPRTPIVAVSANAMQHQIEQYRAVGMDVHVSKPIQAAALYAALEEAMAAVPAETQASLAG